MLRRLAVMMLAAGSVGITAAAAAAAASPALAVGAGTAQSCGVVQAAGWVSTLGPAGTPRSVWGLGKMVGNTWTVKAYGPHGATPSSNLCPNAIGTTGADSPADSPSYKTQSSGAVITGADGASCLFGGTAGSERGFDRANASCQTGWGVATFMPTMPAEKTSVCKKLVGAAHGSFPRTNLWVGEAWGTTCTLVASLTRRLSGRVVSSRGTKVRHFTLTGSPFRWVCNLDSVSVSCAQMSVAAGYGLVRSGPDLAFAPNLGLLP